jgi:NADPH:quinone reductase-like Zn-dependent oxidoreductase
MSFADMARAVLAAQGVDKPVVVDPAATYFGTPVTQTSLVTGDGATRLHPVRRLARSPALSAAAELAGQTALVTGGTAGIGFETARLLAQAGASVIITGRDADRGARAAAALSSFITGSTLHADGGGAAA